MASAKEATQPKEQENVTFYLVRLDGELNIRETPIHYPFGDIRYGRTKDEDERDVSRNVTFIRGSYTTNDPFIIEWLRKYNTGGAFIDHNGKNRVIQPNHQMFLVTEEDPAIKVKTIVKKEIETVEVEVLQSSFVKLLEIDQLEQWAIGQGLSIPTDKRTKEGLIEFLTSQGRIK